ncbi:MAG: DoxX family protein, partial [Chitinophagales bacterium]
INFHFMDKSQAALRVAGLFFIRSLLGIIFFMQGFGKVFSWGVPKVYEMFFREFENTFLPKWLVISTAYFTSYVEWIGGFLLIIGLFRKYAMYLLALDILVVSFGHGLREPIWDLSHVMPRSILLVALFLLPKEWDKWNLDSLIKKRIS